MHYITGMVHGQGGEGNPRNGFILRERHERSREALEAMRNYRTKCPAAMGVRGRIALGDAPDVTELAE